MKLSIMKKLILITILSPIISFSQTYYDSALNFQNEVRNYYDLNPLEYDSSLSLHAQEWDHNSIHFPISNQNRRIFQKNYGIY